jgi:hypothetical protein
LPQILDLRKQKIAHKPKLSKVIKRTKTVGGCGKKEENERTIFFSKEFLELFTPKAILGGMP